MIRIFRLSPRKLLLTALSIILLYIVYLAFRLSPESDRLGQGIDDAYVNHPRFGQKASLNRHSGENSGNDDMKGVSFRSGLSQPSPMFMAGVSKNDFESYRMAFESTPGKFQCLRSKEIIPEDNVNDDYCDCVDGSDEPSTSACSHVPNSRYYCKASCTRDAPNEHSIPSSRVNDGICDCCDGSDEVNHISDRSKNKFYNQLASYVNVHRLRPNLQQCFV